MAGFNIGNISSIVSGLTSKIDVGSLTSGINISSLSPDSIGGLKSTIEGKLNGLGSEIENELMSSFSASDIESMVGNVDIESKVNEMMNSSGMNGGAIDESQIQSMIDEMMGSMGLSDINTM